LTAYARIKQPELWAQWVCIQIDKFLGSPQTDQEAFVYHITDLRSTRTTPEPKLVGLMGFHKSTTVVAIDHSECFGAITWLDETELNVPSFVKLKATLSPSGFHSVSP
jgi:hypothetical protein